MSPLPRTVLAQASNVPDDRLAEIGRIAVNWSHLEYMVLNSLVNVLGLTAGESAFVIPSMSYSQCVSNLMRLLMHRFPENSSTIQEHFKAIADAKTKRDDVLHNPWWVVHAPEELRGTSVSLPTPSRRGNPKEGRVYSPAELRTIAAQVRESHRDFFVLLETLDPEILDITFPLAPWPDIAP